ncbi:MAG: hypothetical protein EBR07_04285, partial [Planctomycetes bacterium]|nr:hypothetical protein [Planctomycetota bacterium]
TGTGAVNINAGAGAITLDNAANNFVGVVNLINTGANNIAIADVNALTLSGVNMTATAAGRLSVTAGTGISQTGAINTGTGAGAINANAGAIALENAGNNFRGSLSLNNTGANNIAIRTAGPLSLSGVSMTNFEAGGLTVTSNGELTQTGAISTGTGVSALNSGNGAIILTNTGNIFGREVRFTNTGASNNVTIVNSGNLVLGTSSTAGALNLTATSLRQTRGITAGNTTLTISAAGGDIDLSTQVNSLGQVTIGNDGGQAANVRDFRLSNARVGAGAIVNLSNIGTTNLRDVSVQYIGASYNIPTLTMASLRDVNFLSNGALTQAVGGIRNSGSATFVAVATNNVITLTDANNNFGGAVTLTNTGAHNIAIRDINALNLAGVSMSPGSSGGLSVNTGGDITQTGAIVTGTGGSVFNAGGGGSIMLTNTNNNFVGAVSLSVIANGNIAIRDANNLVLSNVGMSATNAGTFTVTNNGALTQAAGTRIITGTGAVAINAGAGAITLNNTDNNFAGATSLTNTGANNIVIRDVGVGCEHDDHGGGWLDREHWRCDHADGCHRHGYGCLGV